MGKGRWTWGRADQAGRVASATAGGWWDREPTGALSHVRWLRCSCKGASHYGLTKDRKRRSPDGGADGCASLTAATLCPEVSAAATVALMTDEAGLDNPAYVPTAEDGQPANGPSDFGRSSRSRGESNGWLSGNGLLAWGWPSVAYSLWNILETSSFFS